MRCLLFFLLVFSTTTGLRAQSLTQALRGQVRDAVTQQALIGADLRLRNEAHTLLAVTDAYGQYTFAEVPVGRYTLTVSYVGYQTLEQTGVLIGSAAPTVLPLELTTGSTELDGITVTTNVAAALPTSVEAIDIEQVLRFPATFYDPARLATSYAGVANTNDQANGLSIRGNSPAALQWRLEGVEIVNPNHTPNAGTFSDRATLYGGGVNILSAQLLGTTRLHKGPFGAAYGNVTGGVLDLELRRADAGQRKRTFQASLLGLDLAAEGPLFQNSNASIAVNARYSFTGLLGAAGIDFGGELISFYDASAAAYLPVGNDGAYFKVIAVTGASSNRFTGPTEAEEQTEEKDLYNIDFEAATVIGGGSYVRPVGTSGVWKTTLLHSQLGLGRTVDERMNELRLNDETLEQFKTAFHTGLSQRIHAHHQLRTGVYATLHGADIEYREQRGSTEQLPDGEWRGVLLEGYAEWRAQWTEQWETTVGVSAQHFTEGANRQSLEPRLAVRYQPSPAHRFGLAYGDHSQLQSPLLYTAAGTGGTALGFQRARLTELSYDWWGSRGRQVTAALFYQDLYNLPVSAEGLNAYSFLNALEGLPTEALAATGTGRNYGVELTLRQRIQQSWYYLVNGTYYESRYTGSDGVERDSRFGGQYLFNATLGKEWQSTRQGRERFLGINGRLNYFGGYRLAPINEARSREAGLTVFDLSDGYSVAPTPYFRADLRVYWTIHRPNRVTTWALDVQNLTSTENLSYQYFDPFLDRVVDRFQLPLIPNFTYRVEW